MTETDASKAARTAVVKALDALPYDAHTVTSHLEYWVAGKGESLHPHCIPDDEGVECDETHLDDPDELEEIARLVHEDTIMPRYRRTAHDLGSYATCSAETCKRLAYILGTRS